MIDPVKQNGRRGGGRHPEQFVRVSTYWKYVYSKMDKTQMLNSIGIRRQ